MSLWSVVFYCVATVSVIEVQLWRLPQYIHVQRDYRVLNVLLKKWTNRRSPLPPDSSGHDRYLSRTKQREWGREKKKEKKLIVVLLGWRLAGAALMNEKAWVFFLLFWSSGDREWPIAINVDQPKLLP